MGGKAKLAFALLLSALLGLGAGACGGGSESTSSGSTGKAERQASTGSSDQASSHPGEPSADFLTPGGDNSIQTYGVEADAEERQAASAVLEAYMAARGDQDWEAACVQLSTAAVEPLESIVAAGSGCRATMAAISKRLAPSAWDNTMTGPIAALRRKGGSAFALYHGTAGSDYFIQMSSEGGDWKVAALEPTAFP
jgi:hypothetical protein